MKDITKRVREIQALEVSGGANYHIHSLIFDVYRSCTYLVIKDEKGNRIGYYMISPEDWDELALAHTRRIRQQDES